MPWLFLQGQPFLSASDAYQPLHGYDHFTDTAIHFYRYLFTVKAHQYRFLHAVAR